jgi:hypothetical protein
VDFIRRWRALPRGEKIPSKASSAWWIDLNYYWEKTMTKRFRGGSPFHRLTCKARKDKEASSWITLASSDSKVIQIHTAYCPECGMAKVFEVKPPQDDIKVGDFFQLAKR